MSQSGITLGPDATIIMRDSNSVLIYNDIIQSFTYKPVVERKDSLTLGKVRPLVFPRNYTGQFVVVRKDAEIEEYFVTQFERYEAGITVPDVLIQAEIKEPNRMTTIYNFPEAVIELQDAGQYSRDSEVIMQIAWSAPRLKTVKRPT